LTRTSTRATLRQDRDEPNPETDKLVIRPTRQPGPVPAAKMDECIQGIISWADQFWVTSLPAPVSDNASRNLWIQTHSQFHVPSTPVNLPPCVRKSFCAEGAEILLIRDSTPTQSDSSPGRVSTDPVRHHRCRQDSAPPRDSLRRHEKGELLSCCGESAGA
jgi:hypothetical protein